MAKPLRHRRSEASLAWLLVALPLAACAAPEDDPFPSNSQEDSVASCPPCAVGQHCEKGACVSDDHECSSANCPDENADEPSCNAKTCPNGCCDGNQCRATPNDDACGSGGDACVACASTETCEVTSGGAACVEPAPATYQIVLVSTTTSPKKASGDDWDTTNDAGCFSCYVGCCPPDIYVSDVSQFAGLSIPKSVSSDTTSANWNIVLGTRDKTSLLGASVNVVLKDEDTSYLPDDVIGNCATTLTAADIDAGLVTLDPSRGCSGSIQSVSFRIDPI